MDEAHDRFLTLLITQLRNQNPLSPMENAEMTSQLAQMSTVSGIERLNATLSLLVDSFGDTQAIQASTMIGKNVLIDGNNLSLVDGVAFGGANLAVAADSVKITIMDSGGNVLQTQELGPQEAGHVLFMWNGQNTVGEEVPDGGYRFTVEATRGNSTVNVSPLQVGMVSALVRSGNTFLLDLGVLGTIDFRQVQKIL